MAAKKKASKKASKKATAKKPPRPKQLELEFESEPEDEPERYVSEEILEIGALDGEIIHVSEFSTVLAISAQHVVMLTVARIDASVRGGMTLDEALTEALESAEENLTSHRPKRVA
jgi:hypothetical protein